MNIYLLNLLLINLFGLVFLLKKNAKFKSKLYLFLCFWPIFIIPALRHYEVGTDTETYRNLFISICNYNGNNIFDVFREEKGYILLNKIISSFTQDPQYIIIISSLIIAILSIIFIYYNSNNVLLSMNLFICLYYFYNSFNVSRQTIAILIVANAYYFAKREKIIHFIIMLIIAYMFHKTAIVGFVIYILFKVKLNNIRIVMIIISIIILYPLLINFYLYIAPQYSSYIDSNYFGNGGLQMLILYFLIFIFGIIIKYVSKRFNKDDKEYHVLLSFIGISLSVGILVLKDNYISRIGWYFTIFTIIFIPYAISKVNNKNLIYLIYTFIIPVIFIYNIYLLGNNLQGIVPYRVFFNI